MSSEILLSFGGGVAGGFGGVMCYRRDVTNEKESSTATKYCIKKTPPQNRVLVSIVTGFREC